MIVSRLSRRISTCKYPCREISVLHRSSLVVLSWELHHGGAVHTRGDLTRWCTCAKKVEANRKDEILCHLGGGDLCGNNSQSYLF